MSQNCRIGRECVRVANRFEPVRERPLWNESWSVIVGVVYCVESRLPACFYSLDPEDDRLFFLSAKGFKVRKFGSKRQLIKNGFE
jgi:hypothetical protein